MTDLYFIRHGQSEANLNSLFAGQFDSPLTELGYAQAEATAKYMVDKSPDIVYASPLKRAYATGLATSDKCNIPIIPDARLMEINAGKWEGVSFDEIKNNYEKDFDIWLNDTGNARCTGGESTKELKERIAETMDDIAKKHDGLKVVIATHATPIRVMECVVTDTPIEKIIDIPWVSNASVTHIRYDNGKWEIISRSFDKHLEGMKTTLPVNV